MKHDTAIWQASDNVVFKLKDTGHLERKDGEKEGELIYISIQVKNDSDSTGVAQAMKAVLMAKQLAQLLNQNNIK